MNISELFKDLAITDHAKTAQIEIAEHLRNQGYKVTMEHPVSERGDGNGGRIDLIATNEHEKLAIEVDNYSPRDKSIFKLKSMDGYIKIVLLRHGKYNFIRDNVKIYSLKLREVI